jgi:DNA-binding transcriptional ArsR family regulator
MVILPMLLEKTPIKKPGTPGVAEEIHSIETAIKLYEVCSNRNRCCILYLLKKCPDNKMQAEMISNRMGISHRTALYHLDVLEDLGLVEVKEFRRRGDRLLRSVWGLNTNAKELHKVFSEIENVFRKDSLEETISRDLEPKRCRKELHIQPMS